MISPLTGLDNCKLIKVFNVEKIVTQYKNELGLDVRRFFKTSSNVELFECLDTGYKFYYPYNIFGDGHFYADLNKHNKGYYIEQRWEHTQALKLLQKGMKVLEIGSGDGHFLKLLSQKNIDSIGLELNDEAVEYGRKNGLNIINELIDEHSNVQQSAYDAICFFQVLEHITSVREFLLSALKCLKPNGLLIIGVPNNNPYIFKNDEWHTLNLPPHHSGLWSKQAFENIEKYFPVHLQQINIEPLSEFKTWFTVQKKYFLKKRKILGLLLSIIPRPIYKMTLSAFKNKIQGRNILAVYNKN